MAAKPRCLLGSLPSCYVASRPLTHPGELSKPLIPPPAALGEQGAEGGLP